MNHIMHYKIKSFQKVILLLLMLTGTGAFAQGINFLHDEPFDKILAMAKAQNKPIFIDGYIQVCAPCKQLDKEVFPLKSVGDYFNSNFINVKYDIEKEEGKKLKALYGDVITGYPSLVLIDKNGKMIHKIGGFHPADSLITKMQRALTGKSLSVMRERLNAGAQSLAFVKEYKQMMKDGFLDNHPGSEGDKVNKILLDRLSDEDITNPEMWKIIGNSLTDVYSPAFARVVKLFPKFQEKGVNTDKIKFQMRSAMRMSMDTFVNPIDKDDKITLRPDPETKTVLTGYLNNDVFKDTEVLKARLSAHDNALSGNWVKMVASLKDYADVKGQYDFNQEFIYQYVQYMIQSACRDKKIVTAAATLLESLPKDKNPMAFDDNYNTIITLYKIAGNKKAENQYKQLQNKTK
jgi:thioredoxin-related protein